jgi:hypothetical protein
MHLTAPIDRDTERSRKRALWLRQLAEGTGHPQFAEKLKDLTEEYDGLAEQLEQETSRAVSRPPSGNAEYRVEYGAANTSTARL